VGPTGTRVINNRRIAGLALAGLVAFSAAVALSGCASDTAFPAVHDMPAARTETKLTPDEVKQATDALISDRDRAEAQAQTPAPPPPAPATTGSIPAKKKQATAAAQQQQTQQSPVSISAYAKQ
jgi:hypothetical protein